MEARWRVIRLIAGIVLVTLLAWSFWSKKREATRAEAARPVRHAVAVSESLISGEFTVAARAERTFPFAVSPEMSSPHLIGRFFAEGPNGADVQVAVMSEEEYPNWANGHEAKVSYSTKGPKTTDRFDVPLGVGKYILAFSNKSSLLFTRNVTSEVALKYSRIEFQPRQ